MSGDFYDLMSEQIRWAHQYNAYARLGHSPEKLALILDPARQEYHQTKRVPEWCGVDLLRGWAFFLTRADRHGGGYGLMEGGAMLDEWRAVFERLATHGEVSADDLPPPMESPRTQS